MKTIIIIIVIVCLILVVDFYTLRFFERETDYYADEINKIIKNINNGFYVETTEQIAALDIHWQKNKTKWNMLCDHSEVEEISLLLATTISSFEHQKYFTCVTALQNLNLSIEFAGDRYSMLIDNIS